MGKIKNKALVAVQEPAFEILLRLSLNDVPTEDLHYSLMASDEGAARAIAVTLASDHAKARGYNGDGIVGLEILEVRCPEAVKVPAEPQKAAHHVSKSKSHNQPAVAGRPPVVYKAFKCPISTLVDKKWSASFSGEALTTEEIEDAG